MGAWEMKHQVALAGWAERVRECRSSGVSVSEWCEGQGIDRRTYYRWEREVLGIAGKQLAVQGKNTEFSEVRIAGAKMCEMGAGQCRVASLRTEAGVLDIYTGADAETLRKIIEALKYAQ